MNIFFARQTNYTTSGGIFCVWFFISCITGLTCVVINLELSHTSLKIQCVNVRGREWQRERMFVHAHHYNYQSFIHPHPSEVVKKVNNHKKCQDDYVRWHMYVYVYQAANSDSTCVTCKLWEIYWHHKLTWHTNKNVYLSWSTA